MYARSQLAQRAGSYVMQLMEACRQRRSKLLQQLGPAGCGLITAAAVMPRNADNEYPFRQNSDFYYLSGFEEPQAALLLAPGSAIGEVILFCRPRDPVAEAWTGARLGPAAAPGALAVDAAFAWEQLPETLAQVLAGRSSIDLELPTALPDSAEAEMQAAILQQIKACNISCIQELAALIAPMRLYKDAYEIECMRQAAAISVRAHQRVWQQLAAATRGEQQTYAAQHEAVLAAHLQFSMLAQGAELAYPSIVAGGSRALTLHYIDNNKALKADDLVLIDAGAEYKNYAADITRTVPVGGKFSAEQAQIYNIVLAAQQAVIAAIKPGVAFAQLQTICVQQLTQGLCDLDILTGEVADLIEEKAYQRFFMHGVSHWLGLDVHDAGGRKDVNGEDHILQAGMCLTVEPGLYMPTAQAPGTQDVVTEGDGNNTLDARWRGIGVRIEDDVLVTADGCEVLTQGLAKTVAGIEQYFAQQNAANK